MRHSQPTIHTELAYAIATTTGESTTDGNEYMIRTQRLIQRTYVTTCGINSTPVYTVVKDIQSFEDSGKQNFALSNGMDSNWLNYTNSPPPAIEPQQHQIAPTNFMPLTRSQISTVPLTSLLSSEQPPMILDINKGYIVSVTPPPPTPSNPKQTFFMSVDAEQNLDSTRVQLNFFDLQSFRTESNVQGKQSAMEILCDCMPCGPGKGASKEIIARPDKACQAGDFLDNKATSPDVKPDENNTKSPSGASVDTQTPSGLHGGFIEIDDTKETEKIVTEYVNHIVDEFLENAVEPPQKADIVKEGAPGKALEKSMSRKLKGNRKPK